jgi:hypothetical protein
MTILKRIIVPVVAGLLWNYAPTINAQWPDSPTAGIPRLANGRPNLDAPSPRMSDGKPNLSGLWQVARLLPCQDFGRMCTDLPISQQFGNIGAGLPGGLPYQEWAKEKMASKKPADDPYTQCRTPGGPRMLLLPYMKKFVQTPDLLLILNEYNTHYRQVFLDGRKLPDDPAPTWNGYSTAHWDGDTLVVESIGYRDDQWLDAAGSPLTNTAKVTERFRRLNLGSMQVQITIDDPKTYTRPWTATVDFAAVLDTELIDAACWENEKDVEHLRNAK